MSRRPLAVIIASALAIAAATLAAACAPTAAPATPSGAAPSPVAPGQRQPSGELTVGFARPSNLGADPGLALTSESMIVSFPLFDALTIIDQQGFAQPLLAQSWTTADGKTWDFVLRDNLRFPNGEPIDAEAVRVTMERNLNADNRLPITSRLTNVAGFSVLDPRTVRFVLKEVDPQFTGLLSQILILPPRAFLAAANPQAFFDKPVGSGPFELMSGNLNDGFSLSAKSGEQASPRGVPNLARVTIKWVAEPAVRQAGLATGELDAVNNMPPDLARGLENQGLKVVQSFSGPVVYLMLRTDSGPLADVRVRQAVNFAVDKKTIVETVLGGYARIDEGQILKPGAIGYNPDVKAYPYDAARARQLMGAAGFPNGFRAKLSVIANPLAGPELGESVARYLRDIGIDAQVQIMEAAIWGRVTNAGTPEDRGEFIVGLAGSDDAINTFRPFSSVLPPPFRRWFSPAFDGVYQQAKSTVDDRQRDGLFKQAVQQFNDQAAVLFLWQPVNLGIMKQSVTLDPGYGPYQFLDASKR